MRRLVGALLVCAILSGVMASAASAQSASPIPRLKVKLLEWGNWKPSGFVPGTTDTTRLQTHLAGTYGSDTTGPVSTMDWSWVGQGATTALSTSYHVGRLIGIATGWADLSKDALDSTGVVVETSPDGRNWSNAGATGKDWTGTINTIFNTKTAKGVGGSSAAANNAPIVVINAPLLANLSAAQAAAGGWAFAPYIRFRVKTAVGAGSVINGLKLYLCYYSRYGGGEQGNQWLTAYPTERPVRWGGYTIAAHDTTGFESSGQEDTTEVINMQDAAWCGDAMGIHTTAGVAAFLNLRVDDCVVQSNGDTLYYAVECSPNGVSGWSRLPEAAGLAEVTASWPGKFSTTATYMPGTDGDASIIPIPLPIYADGDAAWSDAASAIPSGATSCPYVRVRIQKGSAGDIYSGVRATLRYLTARGH